MSTVVPDASVILKWVLPAVDEPYHAAAVWLRSHFLEGRVQFLVPSLWRFEVGNTLTRKQPESAPTSLRDLHHIGMTEPNPTQEWLTQACALAREYAVAFYDAAYHALAIVESGTFVTADERYLRAVGRTGNVCHLAEWRL